MEEKTTTIDFPKTWPGAFAIYKISRDYVRRNLSPLLMLVLLSFATSMVISVIFTGDAKDVGQLISYFTGAYFTVVLTRAALRVVRDKHITFEDSLPISFSLYWRMILLNILVMLTVAGGLILLIVPGIIFGLRLSAASYFLVDKNMGVMEAYKASWHATKGHLGKLWGIIGVGFLMLLPALTIIGILVTVYLYFMFGLAGVLFYLYLLKHPNKQDA